MKNNISYYRHETGSHRHWKFKALRRKYKWDGEGKFWALNNMIGESDGCVLDVSDEERLFEVAAELDMEVPEFNEFLEHLVDKCKLIIRDGSKLTTKRTQDVLGDVNSKRQRDRERKLKLKGVPSPDPDTVTPEKGKSGKEKRKVAVEKRKTAAEKQHSIVQYSIVDKNIVDSNTIPNNTTTLSSAASEKSEAENKFTDDQEKLFAAAQQFIAENAPRVAKMKEPLTIEQFFKLIDRKYPKGLLKEVWQSMHNYEPLLRKNRSAYLTTLNWADKRVNEPQLNSGAQNNGTGNGTAEAIYKARQKEASA